MVWLREREVALVGAALKCIIMGAAGRDFHDFQSFFRDRSDLEVVAFTAAQIPFIDTRSFPRQLAGERYDRDIPIFAEERLEELIIGLDVDFVFLAYSDLDYSDVMHKAATVQAAGAGFALLGPKHTQLACSKPVVAVTAVRTGAGKSPLTQWLAQALQARGRRVVVVRHPMPYGEIPAQLVQRFERIEDLDRHRCTIEEREEYEPYLESGVVIYAGVDYARIVDQAAAECDVLLWDGGNNDLPFIRPTVQIVVADALRAGHESSYYPGEVNFRRADVLVINKVSQAGTADVWRIRRHAASLNPRAPIIESDLDLVVDDREAISGQRVLVVEDGPTLTHGGMSYGAGYLAANEYAAAEIVDPRPFARGTIAAIFEDYPHIAAVLPAMGYSESQRAELARTIDDSAADVVIDASPANIAPLLGLGKPVVRVRYAFAQRAGPALDELVLAALDRSQ